MSGMGPVCLWVGGKDRDEGVAQRCGRGSKAQLADSLLPSPVGRDAFSALLPPLIFPPPLTRELYPVAHRRSVVEAPPSSSLPPSPESFTQSPIVAVWFKPHPKK